MNLGEQLRTLFIEPIEEEPDTSIEEPESTPIQEARPRPVATSPLSG
jgi:hypothetical protein